MNTVISIKNIQCKQGDDYSRVSADVGGGEVWYKSQSALLQAPGEVFASAFLLPAMASGQDLYIDVPLSETWLNNSKQLMELFHEWWGYAPITIHSAVKGDCYSKENTKTGLFFSGGVDSFYSLLCAADVPDELIYVFGFDLQLKDTVRFQNVEYALQQIAQEIGLPLHVVETNVREHPLLASMDWAQSHGGALASVAHCFGRLNKVVISASVPRSGGLFWGSHWASDPLWSSDVLQILHYGEHFYRNDKLRVIIDDPLVRKYLRVCWKYKNNHVNCCRCEKCIRTMLILKGESKLHKYETFPLRDNFLFAMFRLPYVDCELFPVYKDLLCQNVGWPQKIAIRVLLNKSKIRNIIKLLSVKK